MTFAFAAAGTGGHLFPAIAVARELTRRGVDSADIVFFGGDRLEADAVPGGELPRDRQQGKIEGHRLAWHQ